MKKSGPILGEGFILLVFEHLDVGDGGMYAGQSGKLTTGNINWNIMFQLIFRASADRLDREIAHKILHRLLEQHRCVRHRPLGSSVQLRA